MDLYEFVQEGARNLTTVFTAPDDDWEQFMFVEGGGNTIVTPLGPLMESAETKEMLSEKVIPDLLAQVKATRVVLLLNVFTVIGQEVVSSPSQHPDRVECLVAKEFTSEGCTRCHMAPIYRDGEQPPGLGPWEEWPTEMEGRFHDSIISVLQPTTEGDSK